MEGFYDDLVESAFNKGDLGHAAARSSARPGRVVTKSYLMELDQSTGYMCYNNIFGSPLMTNINVFDKRITIQITRV